MNYVPTYYVVPCTMKFTVEDNRENSSPDPVRRTANRGALPCWFCLGPYPQRLVARHTRLILHRREQEREKDKRKEKEKKKTEKRKPKKEKRKKKKEKENEVAI